MQSKIKCSILFSIEEESMQRPRYQDLILEFSKDTVLTNLWQASTLLVSHQEATLAQDIQSSSLEIQEMQLASSTPSAQSVWDNPACVWTWV